MTRLRSELTGAPWKRMRGDVQTEIGEEKRPLTSVGVQPHPAYPRCLANLIEMQTLTAHIPHFVGAFWTEPQNLELTS